MVQTQEIDVLIVGGGFSTMPLIRELDASGIGWLMVSELTPIWQQLEAADALDFDLVSSLQSSVYSFELVDMLKEQGEAFSDGFPTAREFYAIHKKYAARYADHIHNGRVGHIDNHGDHSIVHLENGKQFRAKHVVVATAFRRKMNSNLKQIAIDESVAGKSVAITSTGDSANLLIAKLVAYGAQVHLITNGFIMLDKMFATFSPFDDGPRFVPLDQLECHNFSEVSKWSYRAFIDGGYIHGLIHHGFAKLFDRNSLGVRHPKSIRPNKDIRSFFKAKAPVENGHIAIKYWPIDVYKLYCEETLEQKISDGYLINDLPFFLEHGHVKLWDKSAAMIDHDAKLISEGGERATFDMIIDGDQEEPAIPEIRIYGDSDVETFSYKTREQYMGVVSPDLDNIYTIGFTRPFTGGLNNISEMQCLLVHRMIADPDFRDSINGNIDQRIAKYNATYYANRPEKKTDHLVWYGTYTDEVAKLLDIRPARADMPGKIGLMRYYMAPNNVFRFREKGCYAVEGIGELIDHTAKQYHDYKVLALLVIRYPFFELLALATIMLAPVPWWVKIPAAIIHNRLPFTSTLVGKFGLPTRESKGIFNYRKAISFPVLAYPLLAAVVWAAAGMGAAFAFSAGLLAYVYAMIHLGTAKGWNRKFFCDMKSKRSPEMVGFFERYRATFKANRRDR
ncbi:MAG: hypothetical protein ABJF89_07280 [Parasphingorhabdus sp.]|uniref:hypothetical protein n=3 Tax=Parasphingorhabdus sp. TaxID=2709688 RepID=UPI003263B053